MDTEKVYENIVVAAFKKAEEEYLNNKKYKLSEYISDQLEEASNIRITSRTFVSYYKKYIEKKEGVATPRHENIEYLCTFLGYDSYEDYVNKNHNENTPITLPKNTIKKPDNEKKITTSLWVLAIIIIGFVVYNQLVVDNTPDDCMTWVGDHFEKIKCSGVKNEERLDLIRLKEFKQVYYGTCDTFFLWDNPQEPIIWYDKSHNNVTLFTASGIHPTNGKTLKSITQTIIDNHIEPCP